MSKKDDLIRNDAVWAAFYRDGKTLGEICEMFECGVYDLSPWLTAPLVHSDPRPSPMKEAADS